MQRRLTKSEVVEEFVEHKAVIEATRLWAMGRLSDAELIERFVKCQEFIDTTPVDVELEAVEYA